MEYIVLILIGLVAFEHCYFLILEMFLWTKPKTRKIFGIRNQQLAEETKVLAANQGLYNGFLAAGLLLSLILEDKKYEHLFFCVLLSQRESMVPFQPKNFAYLWYKVFQPYSL